MNKKISIIFSTLFLFLFLTTSAFAHVVVKPNQVGVGAFQTFSMGVPNEKDIPTVTVKLLIPEGLQYVMPNVKSGWTIDIKKTGEGEDAKVTEIYWIGGTIPEGQRDEFLFQAQVPASKTTLIWKAYQTYEDGSIVAWDHDPKAAHDHDNESAPAPYSTTTVINDLQQDTMHMQPLSTVNKNKNKNEYVYLWLGVAGFILSVASLTIQLRRKK